MTPSRREFAGAIMAFSLVEMVWTRGLFADSIKPVVGAWFKDLNALGDDLRGKKLKDTEFQAKMEELYKKVDFAELLKFVELDKIVERVKLPANGAFSTGFDLGKVEGMSSRVNFGKQIFCMGKNRAVVPHGHENMCTGFIVLKGSFRGRHYDKLETLDEHFIIKPTIDRDFKPGEVSTVSDHKDNVHWFTCTADAGYIFNMHFNGYDPTFKSSGGRLYLDPLGEKLADGLIKAKKMNSGECHKKFG